MSMDLLNNSIFSVIDAQEVNDDHLLKNNLLIIKTYHKLKEQN
jgi:hypothetical protein